MEDKTFNNVVELLEEHDCNNLNEFKKLVYETSKNIANLGYCSGNNNRRNAPLETEITGIFFTSEDSISPILHFPFTLFEFNWVVDAILTENGKSN